MDKIFSFTGAKKIVFGRGAFQKLPEHIGEFSASRPLIIMDKQLAATGLKERVADLLKGGGLKGEIFARVDPEPKNLPG